MLINDGQPEYECHHILLCQPEYEWCIPVHLLSIQSMNDNSWILVLVMWCDWCVCVRAIEIGGRSAATVAAGCGEQQQKVVQAPALRQPLSPVVMSATQQ